MADTKEYINSLASKNIPFLFIMAFDPGQNQVIPLTAIDPDKLLYQINQNTNTRKPMPVPGNKKVTFSKYPILFETYQKQFDQTMYHLKRGDSYLTNLTCQTPIECNLSLFEIYQRAKAKYKIWYRDEWVVFSPETFVKIEAGQIYSFPMKGTIDAALPDAETQLLKNPKEAAEHATIVDLIRNDLSRVATSVKVEQYRYIDKVKTNQGTLLQASSRISGNLAPDYKSRLGDILFELLPAGSISGAPKEKTVEIINQTESYQRGFYTGICGIFDGQNLDSGVMIRFIEKQNSQYYYKSGGGITVNSNAEDEYHEMIQKVYLPF
ncbi:MAG: aminodeoxychorismate synthase component I [Salinivirgaceae bacterium]